MSNGQMNIASMLTAMPFIASEASAAAVVTMAGTPQNGSNFAKLLDVQQAVVKQDTATEPEKTEQPQTEVGNNSDFINVALQMALAGQLQFGMPEGDNKQVQLPVDMMPNATMAMEQPAVTTDTAAATTVTDMPQNAGMAVKSDNAQKQQNVTMAIEQPAIMIDPAAATVTDDMQQKAAMTAEPVIAQNQHKQQNVTVAIEQPAIMIDPKAATVANSQQNATMTAKSVNEQKQSRAEVSQTAVGVVLPAKAESATDALVTVVSEPRPVGKLQNVAIATEPVIEQKQQQPEAIKTAVGVVAPAKTESVTSADTTVVAAELPVDMSQSAALTTEQVNGQKQQQPEVSQSTFGVVSPNKTESVKETSKAIGPEVQKTVVSETPETVASKTPETVASKTPETVASKTPELVAPKTPETVTSKTPELVASKTPETVASKTPETVVSEPTPVARLQNVAKAAEPTIEQKQQQPEVARTAVGIVTPAKTESVRPVATNSVSAALAADRFRNMAMAESFVASPAPSAKLESGIQQAEPHQITAGVAVAPVATDQFLNETLTLGQRLAASPIAEKVVDLSNVKESTSTLKLAAFGSTPILDLDSTNSNSQGESGTTSDNPDTSQNMQGQPLVEQHKMSAVTTRQAATEPLPQEISEQVMPQVKERLEQHELKQGKQQITLTLSPENLGELKMNLNLQGGKLTVEIVTENRSVRDAIMQNADTLKESLARQNITMESFDITTGGKGSANQGQNQNAWRELMQQQQQQQQQQFWASSRGYAVAQSNSPSEPAMQQIRQGESMLDIHY